MKIIGCILVVFSCIGIGRRNAEHLIEKIHMLEELQQALQYLYGEIRFSACDMKELFERLSKRGKHFSTYWKVLSSELEKREGMTLSEIWDKSTVEIAKYDLFSYEEKEWFQEIGRNMGNLDRETQLHTIEILQERLQNFLKRSREECREKSKLYHVLGVTAGLFLCVLLI